MKWFTRNWRL